MSAYIPVDLKRRIKAQFSGRCAYCQSAEHLTVAIFEVEHIIPQAAGGETHLTNLCYTCPSCNRYKAIRQTAPDPETRAIVPLFHPQQDHWADHFTWNQDSTTLIGLTPTGRATIEALRMNRPQLLRVRRMWVKLGEHPPQTPLPW